MTEQPQQPQYNITMSTTETLTYEDGFADGYSRGWQECWEYMREISAAQEDSKVSHSQERG